MGGWGTKKKGGWRFGLCLVAAVCRVRLSGSFACLGSFWVVRAPCCRRRGSSSPSAAPLLSPAHAPGSAALFPAGSGARLAARKFVVLWGRMSPKKKKKSPTLERGSTAAGAGGVGAGGGLSFALGRSLVGGSLSLGARGLFRARGALWGRKVPPPPAPAAVPQKGWEEEKGLMCLVRRAAARAVGRVRGGRGSLAAFACCVRFFWLGRGVGLGGVPIPPNPSVRGRSV